MAIVAVIFSPGLNHVYFLHFLTPSGRDPWSFDFEMWSGATHWQLKLLHQMWTFRNLFFELWAPMAHKNHQRYVNSQPRDTDFRLLTLWVIFSLRGTLCGQNYQQVWKCTAIHFWIILHFVSELCEDWWLISDHMTSKWHITWHVHQI